MKKLKNSAVILLLGSILSCSPAQRDWRNNTSIDVSVGGDTHIPTDTYTTVGASYYLDGITTSIGMWNDFYGNIGPYWGLGWSFLPFGD